MSESKGQERVALSVPEAAARLGISRAAAYNLVNSEGFYPAFRIGTRILVSVCQLDKWVVEQTSNGKAKERGD